MMILCDIRLKKKKNIKIDVFNDDVHGTVMIKYTVAKCNVSIIAPLTSTTIATICNGCV